MHLCLTVECITSGLYLSVFLIRSPPPPPAPFLWLSTSQGQGWPRVFQPVVPAVPALHTLPQSCAAHTAHQKP